MQFGDRPGKLSRRQQSQSDRQKEKRPEKTCKCPGERTYRSQDEFPGDTFKDEIRHRKTGRDFIANGRREQWTIGEYLIDPFCDSTLVSRKNRGNSGTRVIMLKIII